MKLLVKNYKIASPVVPMYSMGQPNPTTFITQRSEIELTCELVETGVYDAKALFEKQFKEKNYYFEVLNENFNTISDEQLKLLIAEIHDIKKNLSISPLSYEGEATAFKVLLTEILEIKNSIKIKDADANIN